MQDKANEYWLCETCRAVNELIEATSQECATCHGGRLLLQKQPSTTSLCDFPQSTMLLKKDLLTAEDADAVLASMGSTLSLPLLRIIIEYRGVFRIKPGDVIDALDPTSNSWRQAIVHQVRESNCLVHWIGWTCVWDDWIDLGDLQDFEVCGTRARSEDPTGYPPPAVDWRLFARHLQAFSAHNIKDDAHARARLRKRVQRYAHILTE